MLVAWLATQQDGSFVTPEHASTLSHQEAIKFTTELDCNKFCAGTGYASARYEFDDALFIGLQPIALAPDFVANVDSSENGKAEDKKDDPTPEPPLEPVQ